VGIVWRRFGPSGDTKRKGWVVSGRHNVSAEMKNAISGARAKHLEANYRVFQANSVRCNRCFPLYGRYFGILLPNSFINM
jgi:hypothetical protein